MSFINLLLPPFEIVARNSFLIDDADWEVFDHYDPIRFGALNGTYYVKEDDLKAFTGPQRFTLFIINAILMTIAVIGNICAIFVILKRKNRCLYKCSLISLASADLIMGAVTGMAHITVLSRSVLPWRLGSLMCSVVPFMQIMALLVNSMTLTCIAIDRYQTIVHAFQRKWDPSPFICYAITAGIWMLSSAIAYPMYTAYTCIELIALKMDPNKPWLVISQEHLKRCVTFDKAENTYYFGALLICIFLPLLFTFMYLYMNIAALIWFRTKPPAREENLEQTSSSVDTNSAIVQSTNVHEKNHSRISMVGNLTKAQRTHLSMCPGRVVGMKRNLRTFKIILVLMIIFFLCRLPIWIFMVIKMATVLNKPYHWFIANVLNIISLLNSALNPFLYTFLNETIRCSGKMKQFCANSLMCWRKSRV